MKKLFVNSFFVVLGLLLFTSCPPIPVDEFIIPKEPDLWYYVASYGSDSADGLTEVSPFKTFRHASLAAASDPVRPRIFFLDFLDNLSEGKISSGSEIFLFDGNAIPRELTLGGFASAGFKGAPGFDAALSLVNGAHLVIRDITIRESSGVGISLDGRSSLVMKSGVVEENTPGVFVLGGSSFLMEGGVIRNNRDIDMATTEYGGGVTLHGSGSAFIMAGDSLVTENSSIYGAGGVNGHDNVVFIMQGSSRLSDISSGTGASNVSLGSYSSFTMEDSSVVELGDKTSIAAGVGSTFTMEENALVTNSLGMAVLSGGTFRMSGNARVTRTSVPQAGYWPAVQVLGSVVLEGNASIRDNDCIGLLGNGSLVLITDNAVVSGNGKKYAGASQIGDVAAVHVSGGELIISKNAQIRDNYGVGVYHFVGLGTGYLTVTDDAVISGNQNGGVWANNMAITLNGNARISNNKAQGPGGGLYLDTDATLVMSGNVRITNNRSGLDPNLPTGSGGGVYLGARARGASFRMLGGTISGNIAQNSFGGGVGVSAASTFIFQDGTISGNTALAGGGVAILPVKNTPNTGGPNFDPSTGASFDMNGGSLAGNMASTYGGGIAFIKPSDANAGDSDGTPASERVGKFLMTDGSISKNEAAAEGGGLYVGSSNYFSVKKQGGVIYGISDPNTNTASAGTALWAKSGAVLSPDKNYSATIIAPLGDYGSWP
jgi:hypothetical protein